MLLTDKFHSICCLQIHAILPYVPNGTMPIFCLGLFPWEGACCCGRNGSLWEIIPSGERSTRLVPWMQLVCWAVGVGPSPRRGMTQHPTLETVLTWSQEGSSLPSYPCSSHIRGAPFFSLSLSFLISAMRVFSGHILWAGLCAENGGPAVALQVFLRQYLNCLPFPEASLYNHLDIELQNGRMKGISHRRLDFYA